MAKKSSIGFMEQESPMEILNGTRIKALRDTKGVSVAEACRATGLKYDTWHNWEMHPDSVPQRRFQNMLQIYFQDEINPTQSAAVLLPAEEMPTAPVYRLPMPSAGRGNASFGLPSEGLKHVDPSVWAKAQGHIAFAYCDGTSMQPTLMDGDLLIIDVGPSQSSRPGIYVVRVADQVLVKRVEFMPGGEITLLSDNPAFAPQTFGPQDEIEVEVLGRVLSQQRELV